MMYTFARLISLLLMLAFSTTIHAIELPDLNLTGDDGKQYSLKSKLNSNGWTLIVVWGPKCPACIEEMPSIQQLHDDRHETGIDVLGLAVDFPSFDYAKLQQVQQFKEDYLIDFSSLLISSGIYFDLGLGPLQGTPTLIIVAPQAQVKAVQLGAVPREVIEDYIAELKSKARIPH